MRKSTTLERIYSAYMGFVTCWVAYHHDKIMEPVLNFIIGLGVVCGILSAIVLTIFCSLCSREDIIQKKLFNKNGDWENNLFFSLIRSGTIFSFCFFNGYYFWAAASAFFLVYSIQYRIWANYYCEDSN